MRTSAAGTGRSGGAVPVEGGWVLSLEGFTGVEEVTVDDTLAVVRPGTMRAEQSRAPSRNWRNGTSSCSAVT